MQTKTIPYTFTRSGYFYFSRRVPSDLLHHYNGPRIVQGLRTKSPQTAKTRALVAAAKLDERWSQLRLAHSEVFGGKLQKFDVAAPQQNSSRLAQIHSVETLGPTLAEALALYVKQKGKGRGKTFYAGADRACSYLIAACGLKPLTSYSRTDALKFRDWLIAKGLSGPSVTRVLSSLKAIINFATSELALETRNPFVGIYHDRKAGVSDRKPIPEINIRKVQSECARVDDEMRWLVALVSDTGMRLAEATGLLREDFVNLDGTSPYIRISPNAWRTLKTESSQRNVPLVGSSLWAAHRIISRDTASSFAFPRYNKTTATNSNSASAALNKWMKPFVPDGCSMHSFRHSMRDRLRALQCPADIVDQIGGWQTNGVGHGYGEGYPLHVLHEWLSKLTI
jgi:integrase